MAQEKPASKTYNELVVTMKSHVVIAERFRFHQRDQAESESVSQYMVELHKLADKYEFKEYLSKALQDRL